jgi:acetylornithine deacetylase/succinyl-diaminopimelate desuccinylase-like protein
LVAFVVVAGPAHAQTLTAHQALALDVFRELVEIDTTDSVGDNTAAARAMARRLLDAGFDPADVHVLEPAARKGNLVVRLRAPAATRPPVLFLAHLDVVEADPADWSVAPFTFLERDGYYYGRGTSDDKDEAAIGVANFIRLKQEGYLPTRDLILALTADEEGGDHNGVQFLLAEHRDLIDAAFVINEGGGGAILAGRRAVNSVQAAEKVYQSFTLEVTNRGGHSSLPRADNAIYQLSSALGRIAAYRFPVELNEVTRAFIRQTAITQAAEEAALARRLLEDPPAPEAVAHFDAEPGMNARLRTTCVATELEAGHAENALPQRARATVNCRILPGVDPASVRATLEHIISDPEITVVPVAEAIPSPPSPLTEDVMAPIRAITESLWPGVAVVPTMSTGATDGLYFRNAGIPVYGVSGIFFDVDDVRAHGRDERILKQSFLDGLEFLYRLARAYGSE